MRFGVKTFFIAVFVVGFFVFPFNESMAKHVKSYKISIPEDKASLAAYNDMTCVIKFINKRIRRGSDTVIKYKYNLRASKTPITIRRLREASKCYKQPASSFNAFSKDFIDGMDSVILSFIYIERDLLGQILYYSKAHSAGVIPSEYKNTKIIFSEFGTIATPLPGNVYIMPDGQEMVFTKDNEWVPCNYVSSQCIPVTKQ